MDYTSAQLGDVMVELKDETRSYSDPSLLLGSPNDNEFTVLDSKHLLIRFPRHTKVLRVSLTTFGASQVVIKFLASNGSSLFTSTVSEIPKFS